MAIEPQCVVEVGTHEAPYWRAKISPDMIVCDRHKKQYETDERYAAMLWEPFSISNIFEGGYGY